jgi:hypothetical protein
VVVRPAERERLDLLALGGGEGRWAATPVAGVLRQAPGRRERRPLGVLLGRGRPGSRREGVGGRGPPVDTGRRGLLRWGQGGGQGTTYYFCSQACHQRFKAAPEQYTT